MFVPSNEKLSSEATVLDSLDPLLSGRPFIPSPDVQPYPPSADEVVDSVMQSVYLGDPQPSMQFSSAAAHMSSQHVSLVNLNVEQYRDAVIKKFEKSLLIHQDVRGILTRMYEKYSGKNVKDVLVRGVSTDVVKGVSCFLRSSINMIKPVFDTHQVTDLLKAIREVEELEVKFNIDTLEMNEKFSVEIKDCTNIIKDESIGAHERSAAFIAKETLEKRCELNRADLLKKQGPLVLQAVIKLLHKSHSENWSAGGYKGLDALYNNKPLLQSFNNELMCSTLQMCGCERTDMEEWVERYGKSLTKELSIQVLPPAQVVTIFASESEESFGASSKHSAPTKRLSGP